jgi:hypothetical protein
MSARTVLPFLVAPALLLTASVSPAQQQPAIPQNLDEMIAAALRSNPEVVLAEARLHQAQAELNQARLKVTREVVTTFNERTQREAQLATAARALQDMEHLVSTGGASKAEIERAQALVAQSRLAIAQTDAAVRYLVGVGATHTIDRVRGALVAAATQDRQPAPAARPERTPEQLVEPLERSVTGPFEGTNLAEVMKRASDDAVISILVDEDNVGVAAEFAVSMPLRSPVTLRQLLLALSDQYRLCFILRDYGVLTTNESRARTLRAASIPPGLPFDADSGR